MKVCKLWVTFDEEDEEKEGHLGPFEIGEATASALFREVGILLRDPRPIVGLRYREVEVPPSLAQIAYEVVHPDGKWDSLAASERDVWGLAVTRVCKAESER